MYLVFLVDVILLVSQIWLFHVVMVVLGNLIQHLFNLILIHGYIVQQVVIYVVHKVVLNHIKALVLMMRDYKD